MIIRRLLPVDALAWRAFRLEMLSEAPAAFGSTFAEVAARPLDSFAVWLDQTHMFAALDGDILGSTGWYLPKKDAKDGIVIAAYLRPDWRGKGIIDKLIDAVCCDAAKQVSGLKLNVVADNTAAINAYRRNGFKFTNENGPALRKKGRIVEQVQMSRVLNA